MCPAAAPSPPRWTPAPCWTSRFAIVAISARAGTFSSVTVSAVSREAAISGNAAFFAPPIGITPARGAPPRMQILSIVSITRAADQTLATTGSQLPVSSPGACLYWTARCRSSGRLVPLFAVRLLGALLGARLLFAPAQVVAQRFGQPFATRGTLGTLFRRAIGGLGHARWNVTAEILSRRRREGVAPRF